MLRFFYNGIKDSSGKLQKCRYSIGGFTSASGIHQDSISIYGCNYKDFSVEIRQEFKVQNDSDYMSDYVCNDRIVVDPNHPLYTQVKEATEKRQAKYKANAEKRKAKRGY